MESINKRALFAIVIVVILVGISFLSGRDKNEGVYDIGVILPLTGPIAKAGEDAKVALDIAMKDFPDSRINLVIEDDAFAPKQTVDIFTKFVSLGKFEAVIGPLNAASLESIRPIAINNKLPAITPYGAGTDIGPFLYKNSVEAASEAKLIADKADEMGFKRLAIIYFNNEFGLRHRDAFRDRVVENGGELVADEPFLFNSTDVRTNLTKIKSAKPDALYIVHNGSGVGMITRQSHEVGLKVQFFGQYATEASDLIGTGGASLDGLIYTFPISTKSVNNKQEKFITEFESRVGGSPQVVAYNTYDIFSLLVEALKKCDEDRDCINNYLSSIEDFSGIGGKFSIVDGKIVREFFFRQIRDGLIKEL